MLLTTAVKNANNYFLIFLNLFTRTVLEAEARLRRCGLCGGSQQTSKVLETS